MDLERQAILEEQGFDLRKALSTVRSFWWIILLCIVISVTVTLIRIARTVPVYRAYATILIDPPASGLMNSYYYYSAGVQLDRQVMLINRYVLAEEVVRRLAAAPRPYKLTPSQVLGAMSATAIEKSNTLQVSYNSRDPEEAAAVVNMIGEVFVAQNAEAAKDSSSRMRKYLEAQLGIAGRQLDKAEEHLRNFKEDTGIFELPEEVSAIVEGISRTNQDLAQIQVEKVEQQARMKEMKVQLRGKEKILQSSLDAVASSPVVSGLKENLVNKEIELTSLRAEYTDKHPLVIKTTAELEAIRSRLRNEVDRVVQGKTVDIAENATISSSLTELNIDIMAAEAREGALQNLLNLEKSRLRDMPEAEVKLARLTRDRSVAEGIYTMLRQKSEEARLTEVTQEGSASLADRATTPQVPFNPQPKKNIAMALLTGLILGLVLVFLVDYLDETIRSSEDAERATGLNLLGLIPHVQGEDDLLVLESGRSSPLMEAYRRLRANIGFAADASLLKGLLVTSADTSEGKSISAANLAVVMARDNRSVILVDADLRRPAQHRNFNVDNDRGLTSVLSGEVGVGEVLRHTKQDGLRLLCSGPLTANSTELLSSQAMKDLMSDLGIMADMVIYDAPPCQVLADSLLLASRVDGTILVLGAGSVNRNTAEKAVRSLHQAGARVLGAILNNAKLGREYYVYGGQDDGFEGRKSSSVGRREA